MTNVRRGKRIGWPQLGVVLVTSLLCLWGGIGLRTTAPPAVVFKTPVAHAEAHSVPVATVTTTAPLTCAQKPCMALTFDDGPDPVRTPQVLDILARHHARATFFVLGVHVRGNEALLKRMYIGGNEIGNHSWGHPNMTTLSAEQIQLQIYNTQAVITAAGVPAPRLFRPPYGAVNELVRSNVPLTIVQWNIDPEDWRPQKPTQRIVEHLGAHARPGGVVIMHDTQQHTLDALDPMLTQMEGAYQFVTVSELLDLAPGQAGIFYGR